jgi:hypothetical protein
MTKKRKTIIVIGAILFTGGVIANLNGKAIRAAYAAWQKEQKQARVDADNAYFQERVEGFLPADWREGSWVQIEYGGWGLHTQCKWTTTNSRYKRDMWWGHTPPPASARCAWFNADSLSSTGEQALEDALNIIVRDKLWEQEDIKPPQTIPDATEITVEFQVGPRAGKFSFYHLHPRENLKLRQLLHKLKVWQADVIVKSRHAQATASVNFNVKSHWAHSRLVLSIIAEDAGLSVIWPLPPEITGQFEEHIVPGKELPSIRLYKGNDMAMYLAPSGTPRPPREHEVARGGQLLCVRKDAITVSIYLRNLQFASGWIGNIGPIDMQLNRSPPP